MTILGSRYSMQQISVSTCLVVVSRVGELRLRAILGCMRAKHPFEMHDDMLAEPRMFMEVIQRNKAKLPELIDLISSASTVFLVGTGSSYHNAWAARYILRAAFPGKLILAQTALDFACYEELIDKHGLVIAFSYRGDKTYTRASLEKAKAVGAPTVLIAGHQEKGKERVADLLLETVPQGDTSAHTVSYTSALALIAAAANGPVKNLANVFAEGLKLESDMQKAAKKYQDVRKIWLAGTGPNEITAKEIALKIKETSYKHTEGFSTEDLLHGPFQSAEPDDLFVLIAPHGEAQDRTLSLIPGIKDIGASYFVIGDDDRRDGYQVSKVAEQYATLSCITPLYLFTYHLALIKGTNPDNFRLEDPRFGRAYEHTKL
jgi:glutamine---fructose-6-phosphate transaminase (isomerizing)